jgi:hypothetical protein
VFGAYVFVVSSISGKIPSVPLMIYGAIDAYGLGNPRGSTPEMKESPDFEVRSAHRCTRCYN